MDPISIITIISFAGSGISILGKAVYATHQAPMEIMALLNDLSDLRLLLTVWDNAVTNSQLVTSEEEFLDKVDAQFKELSAITKSLYRQGSDGRYHFQRAQWLRKRSKVVVVKGQFSNSIQVLRDIVALRNDRLALRNDAAMGRIELRQISMHKMLAKMAAEQTTIGTTNVPDTSVAFEAHLPQECSVECTCQCHYRFRQRTPPLADRILGHLFVGYIGMPVPGSVCDTHSCRSSQVSSWRVIYTFPSWFLRRSVDAVVGRGPYGDPVLNISVPSRRQYDSTNSLFHLARQGKVVEMKRLLDMKLASPYDVTAGNGRTAFASALSYATTTGDLEPCRLLISYKARLDRPDDYGRTDMLNASQIVFSNPDRNLADKLTLLLGMTSLLQVWDFSPLHKIVLGLRSADLGQELANTHHSLNALDNHHRTALHWASWRGDASAVRELLRAGCDPQLAEFEQLTALHFAVVSGNEECVDMLLRAKARVDTRNAQGIQPISFAASSCHDNPVIIRLLHDAGADVNSQDRHGVSALQDAAVENRSRNVQALLDLGANVNAFDKDGDTPLFDAVRFNSLAVIAILLQHGVDFGHVNKLNMNIWHVLARFGTLESLTLIAPHLDAAEGPFDLEARDVEFAEAFRFAIIEDEFEDAREVLSVD